MSACEAGVSEQTFHRCKRELGMLDVDQVEYSDIESLLEIVFAVC